MLWQIYHFSGLLEFQCLILPGTRGRSSCHIWPAFARVTPVLPIRQGCFPHFTASLTSVLRPVEQDVFIARLYLLIVGTYECQPFVPPASDTDSYTVLLHSPNEDVRLKTSHLERIPSSPAGTTGKVLNGRLK